MRYLIPICLLLAACLPDATSGSGPQQNTVDSECRGLGYEPGTMGYLDCRKTLTETRKTEAETRQTDAETFTDIFNTGIQNIPR